MPFKSKLEGIKKALVAKIKNLKSSVPEKLRWKNPWFLHTVSVFIFFTLLLMLKHSFELSFFRLPTYEKQKEGIQLFDREDKVVVTIRKHDIKPVKLSSIAKKMRQAVIAIEDRNFYQHLGIDFIGIGRALLSNIEAGEVVEGGSTISQQLSKVIFLDLNDRTYKRKMFEALISIDLETGYSKEKILETYLNNIYFGRGAYGIESASLTYFGKPASKLNLSESAFLAGLIKAPSTFGNKKNLSKAKQRQKLVLNAMKECDFISEAEETAAKEAKLSFKSAVKEVRNSSYVQHVLSIADDIIGEKKFWKRSYRIYTNLDTAAQKAAEVEVNKRLTKKPYGLDQGALISINVEDGSIVSMVGGVGSNQWNRALNPHTVGSVFKPFVYLSGLVNKDLDHKSIVNDSPIVIRDENGGRAYTPENYDHKYMGLLTVRDALALSRNVCAVKVAHDIGMKKVIETAQKTGITSKMDPYPSLALGTCALTPLEVANAYSTIARGGVYIKPRFIRKITTGNGKVIKEFKVKRARKLPEEPVFQIVDAMQDVITRGTGRRAHIPGVAIAGKTGTSDQSKDVWFVGFTPELVTAVWAGTDDNSPAKGRASGGTVSARIWRDYMTTYFDNHKQEIIAFTPPEDPLVTKLKPARKWPTFIHNAFKKIVGLGNDKNSKPKRKPKGESKAKKLFKSIISDFVDSM